MDVGDNHLRSAASVQKPTTTWFLSSASCTPVTSEVPVNWCRYPGERQQIEACGMPERLKRVESTDPLLCRDNVGIQLSARTRA